MWKTVSANPKYEVSDSGEVRIASTGLILKQRLDRYGYLKVTFNENGKAKSTPTVHKLVASAFIENPHGYNCVNHKNEDKLDNSASNLEWCTTAYNNSYGTHPQKCGESKEKAVVAIKDGQETVYPSARKAGAELGIPWRYIGDAIHNRGGRVTAGGYRWRFATERR